MVPEQFDAPWRITIADNASTDDTPLIAARLAAELPGVALLRLDGKGRGRALKRAWLESTAEGGQSSLPDPPTIR